MFQVADGGTLFLDEVGELPQHLQVKLLRVLQERRIKPVGDVNELAVDVRILAATNRDLEQMVAEGRFREDLYYRLNVITIAVPPLRERQDDIPHIAQYFLEKFAREFDKPTRWFSPECLTLLKLYRFAGNVRELENIVEHAVTFSGSETIGADALPDRLREPASVSGGPLEPAGPVQIPSDGFDLDAFIEDIEKRYLVEAMRRVGDSKTEAARLLGISFRSMRYKLDKYKLG
jgi:two-component system response regulator PilR (NtrC family)